MTGTTAPHLLVPMAAQVIAYNPKTIRGISWAYAASNYTTNTVQSFGRVEPSPPLPTATPTQLSGAAIMWSLPDALAQQQPDGGFRAVPDRWLVIRRATPNSGGQTLTGWVIESNNNDGSNAYLTWNNNQAVRNIIGKAFPAATWADSGTATPVLTAVGPGNPSYASYLPNVSTVFGFVDSLSDITTPATLSYLVVGWYGTPANDPLAGCTANTLAETLAALGWSLAGQAPPTCPSAILCHGMTQGVVWDPNTQILTQSQTGVPLKPAQGAITIGVGNTTIDALCAVLEKLIKDRALDPKVPAGFASTAVQILQGARYGLLDRWRENAGDFRTDLAMAVHDGAFTGSGGGSEWQLTPKTAGIDPLSTDSPLYQPLVTLNENQASLTLLNGMQSTLTDEVYANWWRQGWLNHNPAATARMPGRKSLKDQYGATAIKNAYEPSLSMLETIATSVASTTATVAGNQDTITANPAYQASGLTLRSIPQPACWTPSDPVVVVAGAGRTVMTADANQGGAAATLQCRVSGETLTGLTATVVQGTGSATIGGANLNGAGIVTGGINAALPGDADALMLESVLVDRQLAATMAGLLQAQPTAGRLTAITDIPQAITSLQETLWGVSPASQTTDVIASFDGTSPAPPAVCGWVPAWIPLMLEWQAEWAATPLTDWSFKANMGDYAYTGTGSTGNTLTLAGLTPLSATPVLQLQGIIAALEPYTSDSDVETVVTLLNDLRGLDLLSQTLTGFTTLLLQRNPQSRVPFVAESDAVSAAVKALLEGGGDFAGPTMTGKTPFSLLRQGLLQLTQLRMIDRFGQALYLRSDQPGVEDPGTVVYADNLNLTFNGKSMAGLPPRIQQAMRLNVDLVDAGQPEHLCGLDPGANPICGWLLPNHLDYGIAVYDAAGSWLGEVVLVGSGARQGLRWQTVPGSAAPLGAPPAIGDPSLSGFITTLLARSDGPQALAALLQSIDESSWASSLFDNGAISGMAALIGQPIAVVRASLSIVPNGFTGVSFRFEDIEAQYSDAPPVGLPQDYAPPVMIGSTAHLDNGVLGYFVKRDFSTFYATRTTKTRSAYLLEAAQHPVKVPVSVRRPDASAPARAAADKTVDLVMLCEPRGALYAISGLFPVIRQRLPPALTTKPLQSMAVGFQVGPLLSEPALLRMPIPVAGSGAWTWTERDGVAGWTTGLALETSDDKARMPSDPPLLRQGWLQLSSIAAKS